MNMDAGENSHLAVSMRQLLNFDKETLMGQDSNTDHTEAMGKLMKVLNGSFPTDAIAENRESELFLNIVAYLLQHLCSEVVLDNQTYKELLKEHEATGENVRSEPLGMGKPQKTWYGTPDARCRGSANSDTTILGQTIGDESPGTTTVVEAKMDTRVKNMAQVVAQSVISSFIESNLHPDLNPMIPAIIIDSQNFGVSLYDNQNNLLLVAWNIPWLTEKDSSHQPAELELDEVGIVILWAILHHR